jgi:hypothetical protein
MGAGSKRTSRPRTPRVAPEGNPCSARDSEQGSARRTPVKGSRASTSDVQELTARDRPTAHPGDLKEALLPELRRLLIAEEFESVLPMAEALLASNPDDEVRAVVAICRSRLTNVYAARLGRLSRVPVQKVPPHEWMSLDLDHRACFLLVHVDSVSSLDMILDTSGMPHHEALRILCELLSRGIITI